MHSSKSHPKNKSKAKSTKQTEKNMRSLNTKNTENALTSKVYLQSIEMQIKSVVNDEELSLVINQELILEVKKVYSKYETLKELCARIVLTISRNTNYRPLLLKIRQILLPLLLNTYLYINQHVASDLINWAYSTNNLILQISILNDIITKIRRSPKSMFLFTLIKLITNQFKKKPNTNLLQFCQIFTSYLKNSEKLSQELLEVLAEGFTYLMGHFHEEKSMEDNHQNLMFQWASLSIQRKCYNKDFFGKLMKNVWEIKKKYPTQIGFISKIMVPYGDKSIDERRKFILLILYSELFIELIQQPNYEDNLTEKQASSVIHSIFKIGEFCDSVKSKTTLQKIISHLPSIPQISENQTLWELESCQNIIYRVLLCAEKCLPNYSLKYYQNSYIERPDFFHLYFMDEILKKRQPNQVKDMMRGLVKKWINHDLRDFNLLSYLSKFIYNFSKKKNKVKALISFFREIKTSNLIDIGQIIHDSSFTDASVPTTNIPNTLAYQQQQSEIKASGFVNRALYIDRFFVSPKDLVMWQPLLQELIDSDFYFITKYFFHLIYSTFHNNIQPEIHAYSLDDKIHQIIQYWQQALKSSKYLRFFTIGQIISSIGELKGEQLREIGRIVFEEKDRILRMMEDAQIIWRETLKNKGVNEEDVENYRKKEKKFKNMQNHLIKCILRMLEKTGTDITDLVPSSISYETAIEIIKKYHLTISSTSNSTIHRTIRILSLKSANNIFYSESHQILNLSTPNRLKYEILREIVFAYFQTEAKSQIQNLKKLITLQEAILRCIDFLISQMNPLYEKDSVACKMIAFQAMAQCYRNKKSRQNEYLDPNQNKTIRSKISSIIYRILYKDPSLLGKYQRKSILILRCECLRWLQELIHTQTSFLLKEQIYLLLLHLSLDQSSEIRILILKILVSNLLYNNDDQFKSMGLIDDILYSLSIIHVMTALDPKIRIRSLSEKIIQTFSQRYLTNQSLIFLLFMKVIHLLINLEQWVTLPVYEIFMGITKIWLTTKDSQYLIFSSIRQLQNRGMRLKSIEKCFSFSQNKKKQGFRLFYLNPKQKKCWLTGKLDSKQKLSALIDSIKKCLIDRNKNARYLKSKKQVLFRYDCEELNKICELQSH